MALIWAVCVVSGGVTFCAGSPSLVYCAGVLVSVVCVWFCVSVVREGVCSIFGVCPKALHFQPWVGLGL